MEGNLATYVNNLKIVTFIFNLIIFILFFKLSLKSFTGLFFIGVVLVLSGNITFINIFMYILSMSSLGNYKKILQGYVFTKLVLFLVVICLGYYGLNEIYNINDLNREVRYTMGFTNPNTASMIFFDIAIGLIYLYPNNKKIRMTICISTFLIYYFTDSRTLLIVVMMLMFMIIIKDRYYFISKKIISNFYFISCGITILIMFFSNQSINLILNRRPEIMNTFVKVNELNLFGNSIYGLNISVDNSYLRILYEIGIIYFVIHILLMTALMKELFKVKDYLAIKICISIFLYDIFEQFTIAHGSFLIAFIIFFILRKNNFFESESKRKHEYLYLRT
ncbi:hypothetical protein [Exiguobacterium sp. s91]|uniref:hypothetical protein n=1 Tax=Exiguobacterium sp. s91 TaxID=2751199 RepID=UPI001BEAE099|nr:hypothetical protein [Exiguobacterium sp. s91]